MAYCQGGQKFKEEAVNKWRKKKTVRMYSKCALPHIRTITMECSKLTTL